MSQERGAAPTTFSLAQPAAAVPSHIFLVSRTRDGPTHPLQAKTGNAFLHGFGGAFHGRPLFVRQFDLDDALNPSFP